MPVGSMIADIATAITQIEIVEAKASIVKVSAEAVRKLQDELSGVKLTDDEKRELAKKQAAILSYVPVVSSLPAGSSLFGNPLG